MRTTLTVGALLLVVAGLWWAAATSGDPSSAASMPATSETSVPPAAPPTTTQPEPTPSKPSPPAAPQPTAANVPTSESPAPPPQAAADVPTTADVPPPRAQGPVDELKQRFATEPRDSGANAIESRIQAAFRDPKIPAGVLGAVVCHKSICKLDIRWTEPNNTAYMLGLTNLLPDLSTDLAFWPAGARDGSGVIPLEVYWGRKPAPAP